MKNLTLDCTRRANKSVNFIIEDSIIYKVATHGIRVKNCELNIDIKTFLKLYLNNKGTVIYLDQQAKMNVNSISYISRSEKMPFVSAYSYKQVGLIIS